MGSGKTTKRTTKTKIKSTGTRRQLAIYFMWVVIALQGAVLLTFFIKRDTQPPRPIIFQEQSERIWANDNGEMFYPLIACLIGAPIFTAMAWVIAGKHRIVLAASWIVFLGTMFVFYGPVLIVMLRVLSWYYS